MLNRYYLFSLQVECLESDMNGTNIDLQLIHGTQPQTVELCGLMLYKGWNKSFLE